MNESKIQARKMVLKMMEHALKRSKVCVPQPLPLLEEKAEKRLSTDGLISWNVILKELNNLDDKDRKEVAKLVVLSSYDIVECMQLHDNMLDDLRDTADYVSEHPEYGKSNEDIEKENIFSSFEDLFE